MSSDCCWLEKGWERRFGGGGLFWLVVVGWLGGKFFFSSNSISFRRKPGFPETEGGGCRKWSAGSRNQWVSFGLGGGQTEASRYLRPAALPMQPRRRWFFVGFEVVKVVDVFPP